MKILSAAQTREADAQTIQEESIASEELMERAGRAFAGWFENKFTPEQPVYIFCGPGNNGGDGLVVARLLHQRLYDVQLYLVNEGDQTSHDFQINLERLPHEVTPQAIKSKKDLPAIPADACVIDALFGTGLSRPVTGLFAETIDRINQSAACVTSIDIPSGLYTDKQTPLESAILQAAYTVSFELPKLAFFLPQHHLYVGEWHTVPIGLSPRYIKGAETNNHFINQEEIQQLLKPRKKFSHKGTYGHALLICGGYGKMGAAVLAARACLRSGVGLLSVQAPAIGYDVLQTAVPEAMLLPDPHRKHLSRLPESLEKHNALGIGPGIGTERVTKTLLGQLLATTELPLVIDADAINLIASSEKLKAQLPKGKIIFTPHPKEFERLVGKTQNEYDRLEELRRFCREYTCYMVLKGSHSAICTPEGDIYFNTTGNAGMATGGTGDVLTGIITALVAQQYSLKEACQLGVYVHGLAGDLAEASVGEIALIASDVIEHLPQAFQHLTANQDRAR
ncbi:NAD(P)H-hydrate dehydratase [Pontibacter sp. JH31]|uniref:Bifunctional NAD(P)H-hydrate repair enzyme n=1 Tax=Pontibacter aquaedesilientis TaxID=2766980 RepID=A0ABR7XG31_9BACT|nr:NAD(P)H-hydrate dehydratase [Pontibacter aquaedesilientis]MBD1397245.1 NAD(P)H-hydrate dehydratase [Pontibacter aquaedesilientis]